MHPLTAFDWDMGRRTLLVSDYFNPPVEVWEDPVPEGHSPGLTFFRTVEELVGAVTDAGAGRRETAGALPYRAG